jgi:hypothetical protein
MRKFWLAALAALSVVAVAPPAAASSGVFVTYGSGYYGDGYYGGGYYGGYRGGRSHYYDDYYRPRYRNYRGYKSYRRYRDDRRFRDYRGYDDRRFRRHRFRHHN